MLLTMAVRLSGFAQTGWVELIDTFDDLESFSDQNLIPTKGFVASPNGGNHGLSWSGCAFFVNGLVSCRRRWSSDVGGSVPTTVPELSQLAGAIAKKQSLKVAQEVGSMAYLVRDAMASVDVQILSFNAYHLRMTAASRKKTDRRDAYWIARSLQTKLHPHPVYLPTGKVRALRQLLSLRTTLHRERLRWQYRARATLRAEGIRTRNGAHYLRKLMARIEEEPNGVDASAVTMLQLCHRQQLQGDKIVHKVQYRPSGEHCARDQELETLHG